MTAGKRHSADTSAPVKANKPSSWFSKWIPGNIAKKAMEAFKLIEKAVFLDNGEESESNKVQVLEIQVKKLQQKVDELMKMKLNSAVPVEAAVSSSKSNENVSSIKPLVVTSSEPKVQQTAKDLVDIVKVNSEMPVKPRPFSAADLMVIYNCFLLLILSSYNRLKS